MLTAYTFPPRREKEYEVYWFFTVFTSMIFIWPSLISEELATKAPSVDVGVGVGVCDGLGVADADGVAEALGFAVALAVAVATFAPCFQINFPLDLTTV